MTKQLTRNQLQEKALFALYDVLTEADMGEEIDVKSLVSGVTSFSINNPEASLTPCAYEEADPYLKGIVIQTIKHLNEIVPIYNAHMNKWTFDRLNRVEQALLLLSYAHYFYVDATVDKGIVIDVAVKLAKVYLDATDYKFVNGILDKVLVRG